MKTLVILPFLVLLFFTTHAQKFEWSKSTDDPTTNNLPVTNVTDQNGNTYCTGTYHYQTDFLTKSGHSLLTADGRGIYLAKYDSTGVCLWAINIAGTGKSDLYAHALSFDHAGDLCLAGVFNNIVDFDPSLSTFLVTAVGVHDVFIAKYDKNGNFKWVKSMDTRIVLNPAKVLSSSSHSGTRITAMDIETDNGFIYTTGYFVDTIDFDMDAGADKLISVGRAETFLAKYDMNGNYIWVKSLKPFTDKSVNYSTDILVREGKIFLTGYYADSIDMDPSAASNKLVIRPSGSPGPKKDGMYLGCYDVSGNFLWSRDLVQSGKAMVREDFYHNSPSLCMNSQKEIIVAGSFMDTSRFGTTKLYSNWEATFAAKYTGTGVFKSAIQLSFTDSVFTGCRLWDVKCDKNDNICVTGDFQGLVNFIAPLSPAGRIKASVYVDFYVGVYNPSGKLLWFKQSTSIASPGTLSNTSGHAIGFDAHDCIYISGRTGNSAIFDTSMKSTPYKNSNSFLVKYSNKGLPLRTEQDTRFAKNVCVYPNPMNNQLYIKDTQPNTTILLYNTSGQLVLSDICKSDKADINVSAFQPGCYFLILKDKNAIIGSYPLIKN